MSFQFDELPVLRKCHSPLLCYAPEPNTLKQLAGQQGEKLFLEGQKIVGISEILLFRIVRLAGERGQTAAGKDVGGDKHRKINKRLQIVS